MAHPREFDISCKVYVGELGHGCPKHELEEKFSKYGTLKNVWVARRPAGFAFVEFDDPRDAEDAVRALDGVRINGRRAKVEMSSGRSRSRGGGGGGGRRGGSPGGGGRRGGSPRGGPRYDDYRSSRRSPSPRRGRSRSRSDSPAYTKSSRSRDRYRSGSRDRNRSASRSVSRSKY